MKRFVTIYIFLFFSVCSAFGQTGTLRGFILEEGEGIAYAHIRLKESNQGALADQSGFYEISSIPYGSYTIEVSNLGYSMQSQTVVIDSMHPEVELDFSLLPSTLQLDQIVITGTKTFKKQTDSPVMVNVINSEMLQGVQACNLSEGLKFQPGLRVETDCQTCNYTQLRMNGLGGGYSQILINGRPIFSPLTGLYGMEQIPTNMIERIEIVRGGGSALYGSSAIGGTVNVITKIPKENSFDVSYTYQNIDGQADDHILSGNSSWATRDGKAGLTTFFNKRDREYYDANGDNFSELPELDNFSLGATAFFQPTEAQKLELNIGRLYEYRYGGEMVDTQPHLALQSEERTHRVWVGNLDYQINFNAGKSSFIAYGGGQYTDRDHFTGIFPDNDDEIAAYVANPPYGISQNTTLQGGVQLNHRLNALLGGNTVLTTGLEYAWDDVFDQIDAYTYTIDQTTRNLGAFFQSDWEHSSGLSVLTGLRVDQHNFVDKFIYSPRVSLLYKLQPNTQFRLSWGTGFRAPQAFDADLHIAFAGGGISRISLYPNLKEERSQSWSASINYDKVTPTLVAGFTLEGFHTYLRDAFYLHPLGEDAFGERFEKRNGDGATVQGLTLELRANYLQKTQLEAGFTLQSSLFDEPIENIEGLEARREFLRTPNAYGYATWTFTPNPQFYSSLNLVYTGSMEIAHFAGAPEQLKDAYETSSPFTNLSIKSGYTFSLPKLHTGLELFGGIKNLFDAYQADFDSGKNRDSNYVYGPAAPRTFFMGLRVKNL